MAFHREPEAMRLFYDGFHPWYRFIEGNTGRSIALALDAIDPDGTKFLSDSVLEHCCGSGSLGLAIAGRCASYRGRDQSAGMLGRARLRWKAAFGGEAETPFERESVLDFSDSPGSFDRVMIAFALHLFRPADELAILRTFIAAAKKSVIVIDHDVAFAPFLALVERLEGSWYEEYRKLDFSAFARAEGVGFQDLVVKGTRVMEFAKG